MDIYKTINDILVHLFNEIWSLEEKAIITEEFKDISNNDMHIIEAIGLGDDSTMSVVARKLKITAGSLTTSMNSLEISVMWKECGAKRTGELYISVSRKKEEEHIVITRIFIVR